MIVHKKENILAKGDSSTLNRESMRYRLLLALFIWLGLGTTSVWSQNPRVADSLLQRLQEREVRDGAYIRALFKYVYNENDYIVRLAYLREGIELAEALDSTYYQARFLELSGNSHFFLGNYPEAVEGYFQALELYRILENSETYTSVRGRNTLGNHIGFVLSYLSTIYLNQEDYPQAKKYLMEALEVHRRENQASGIAGDLLNLGEVYRLTGQYDSANILFEQAYLGFDTLNMAQYCSYALGNLGLVLAGKGDLKNGELLVDSATTMLSKFNDGYGISAFQTYLGQMYVDQGRWVDAERVLMESLSTAKKYRLKEQIRDANRELAEVYEQAGNFQQAYYHQSQFLAYKDTLTNEKNTRQLAEMRADYTIRSERLESELEVQELESKSRVRLILAWCMGIGLSFIGVLAGILFRIIRQQRQSNYLLEQQKERIKQKSDIIEDKSKEIMASIQYASRIQRAMLPYQNKISTFFPQHFILLKPRDIVSGDFYWMQEIDGRVLLAVADCTGHGVPGALMSMLGISLLDELSIGQGVVEPGELLERLHGDIHRQLQQETSENRDGLDIALICWDPWKKELQFAGAKLPLVYIQEVEGKPCLKRIKGDRIFIGGDLNTEKPDFKVHTLKIDRPTQLFLFTDGFQDQFGGPQNKKFRPGPFREHLLQVAMKTPQEQRAHLDATFEEWRGKDDQLDDVLVVGLKVG